ncbi:MAG: phosphonate C-P lyase system protein PhnG [Pseudomonadota bacterium]
MENAERKDWMSLLAKTAPATLQAACADLDLPQDVSDLRVPEIGGVMVRGREGATGNAFNLGEMTVTRAAVQLGDGTIGYSYVQGRDRDHARLAAILDAMLQTDRTEEILQSVIQPLKVVLAEKRAASQVKADQTKVDFFTMVRGEG